MVRREALTPDHRNTVDIGLRSGPDLEAGMPRFEVHRQCGPQIGEPRMHFAANRAAARAGRPFLRQQSCLWSYFIEIFADCQSIPDPGAVMNETGDEDR